MARGGFRPGSGPAKGTKYNKTKVIEPEKQGPKKPTMNAENLEADEYLRAVWNNPGIETSLRIRAAEIVVRSGPAMGKKDELNERARTAGAGRFGVGRAPLSLLK